MLTQIGIDSENAFTVPILGVTPKDSLLVRKITGLNPPDRNLFLGDYARDGGAMNGSRVGFRNVVIIFELNPNPALGETISGLRELLYKTFMSPQKDGTLNLNLKLYDDLGRIRYVTGYTEKIETEIFEVDNMVQVSMVCVDPYIKDVADTVFSSPSGWVLLPTFTYGGTADTGFIATVYIDTATPRLTLDNNSALMRIDNNFLPGDIVTINTNAGSREVSYYPAATPTVWTPLIAKLTSTSPWIQLHAQSNTMRVYSYFSGDIVASIRSLKFKQAYWGV